jgi:hypothetical protein
MNSETITNAVRDLWNLVGPYWPYAWAAAFFVMVLESSQPKAPKGEEATEPTAFTRLGMICSAAIPFVLILHGFGAFILANQTSGTVGGEALLPIVTLFAAVGVLVIVPGLLGAIVGRLAPGLGRALHAISRPLAIGVLVFALYVTWNNLFMVLDLYVLSRSR